MSDILFRRVTIIGVGLIGGSIGMCLRQKKLTERVVGITRRKNGIEKLIESKAVDEATDDLAEGIARSELVIVATPVGAIVEQVKSLVPLVKPGTIIMDVGSSKAEVVNTVEKILPRGIYFVGTHPLAGSQKSGVQHARADLFEKTVCVLTTTPKTHPTAFRKIREFWRSLGCEVKIVSPLDHDLILARTSHVPHIITMALVGLLESGDESFVASGFRDTTRIAGSDPQIWRDILLTNKKPILKALRGFNAQLDRFIEFIEKKDEEKLVQELEKLQSKRAKL